MSVGNKIVIVGGGTAGWMSANILAFSLQGKGFDISLLESPEIGIIGVGEGSTPALKLFFDKLGIKESEWMPACNGTYKCGITFKDWSTKVGFESYYHPFAAQIDHQTIPLFIRNAQARLKGLNVDAQPEQFFLSAYLAKKNLAPLAHHNFPFETHYGYHFDSHLLGEFLKKKAAERGIKYHVGTVVEVTQTDDGRIDALKTKEQGVFKADMYIDCTGFSSYLSQKKLATPYLSYSSELFNDSAVAMATDIGDVIPSQTVSTALTNGWAWKIPLTNRYGNGYVYSSKYCSADDAETELRRHLNKLDADVKVRHLKMKVGRVEKSWNKNVLAVGLSQGFIEPLEATALILVQQTVSLFAHYYLKGQYSNDFESVFNQAINEQFDGTKDYIHAHYQTNTRDDSDYWRDNRNNRATTSDSLKDIYKCWLSGGDLGAEIHQQKIERFYPVSSWYSLLAGMGMFADSNQLMSAPNGNQAYDLNQLDDFLSRCALNFDDHRAVLTKLGAKFESSMANRRELEPSSA